jgi:hypothetical protein
MKQLIDLLLAPWRRFKARKEHKKRIEDLRKRDPFIYK